MTAASPILRSAVALTWAVVSLLLARQHTFWRDEVRALSIALQGDDLWGMLQALHGEGHPAVWYLILRGGHAVLGNPVLPIAAWLIAAVAMALFIFRAPLRWPVIAIFALGNIAVFEYAVMARSYGVSMLLMFAFAELYRQRERHWLVLGIILASLANTNIHSVILVGGFLLLWGVDIVRAHGLRYSPASAGFSGAVSIATIGIAACIATIYPPFNEIARFDAPDGLGSIAWVAAPASQFPDLTYGPVIGDGSMQVQRVAAVVLSVVMLGSLVGVVRSAGAFLAGLVTLFALALFYGVIYSGALRHEALWLVFVIALYWIEAGRADTAPPGPGGCRAASPATPAIGYACLLLLLMCQVPDLVRHVGSAIRQVPRSQSRAFAAFLSARPEYDAATLISDPDFLLEALPYYLPNPLYLMRESRFGRYVKFTRAARLVLSLDDILESAAALSRSSPGPVIILMSTPLTEPPQSLAISEGYHWTLLTPPEQVRRFLRKTRPLGRFEPAQTDESFDAYAYLTDAGG